MASSTMMTEHHPDGNEDDDLANVSVSVSLDRDNDGTSSSGTQPVVVVATEPASRIDDTSDEDLCDDCSDDDASDVGSDDDNNEGGDWENNGSIDEVLVPERDNVGELQENVDVDVDDESGSSSEVDVWSIIYGDDEPLAHPTAAVTTATGGGGQEEEESPSNPANDIQIDSYREQLEQDIHRLVERQARLRQELERVEEERQQRQQSNSNNSTTNMAVVVLGRLFRVITYPITIVLTIVVLILTLTFCIFPVVLFFIAAICLYYCMIDDPMVRKQASKQHSETCVMI